LIADQTIQAIEPFAHIRRTRCKINPRRRDHPEHSLQLSSTVTSCARVAASKPRPTSTLRPFDNNTVNAPGYSPAAVATVEASSTATRRLLLDTVASSLALPILLLLQMAVQRAQRHAVTSTELTSSHPARPIQTCQPLYLRSTPSTNYHSRLAPHKQSSSQILSSKKVRSSDAHT
jgi:hypothetical protein